jgi:hypothetical protein
MRQCISHVTTLLEEVIDLPAERQEVNAVRNAELRVFSKRGYQCREDALTASLYNRWFRDLAR